MTLICEKRSCGHRATHFARWGGDTWIVCLRHRADVDTSAESVGAELTWQRVDAASPKELAQLAGGNMVGARG